MKKMGEGRSRSRKGVRSAIIGRGLARADSETDASLRTVMEQTKAAAVEEKEEEEEEEEEETHTLFTSMLREQVREQSALVV